MNTRLNLAAALGWLLLFAGTSPSAHAQACVDVPRVILWDQVLIDPLVTGASLLAISGDGREALGQAAKYPDDAIVRWTSSGITFSPSPDFDEFRLLSTSQFSANLEYATLYRRNDFALFRWTIATGEVEEIPLPDGASEVKVNAIGNDGALFGYAGFTSGRLAWRGTPAASHLIGSHVGSFEAISDDGTSALHIEPTRSSSSDTFRVWHASSGQLAPVDGVPDGYRTDKEFLFVGALLSRNGSYVTGVARKSSEDPDTADVRVFRWSAPDNFTLLGPIPSSVGTSVHHTVLNDGTVLGRVHYAGSSTPVYGMWPPGAAGFKPASEWLDEKGYGVFPDVEQFYTPGWTGALTGDGSAFVSYSGERMIFRPQGGCTAAIIMGGNVMGGLAEAFGYLGSLEAGEQVPLTFFVSGISDLSLSFSSDGVSFTPVAAIPVENRIDQLNQPGAAYTWTVPSVNTAQGVLRVSGSGRTKDYGLAITGPAAVTPVISDLRLSGGTIREDSFPGVSARLAQGEALVELQLTDSAGAYTFSEIEEGQTYDLKLTDTDTWGVERSWTGLLPQEVYKQARLPATLMKQLDALADTMALRHYDEDAARALITPFEQWAGSGITEQAVQVDTALARLIVAHQALQTMYGNTLPVSKELATGLAELLGFGLSFSQSWGSISSTIANRNLPIALANRFQRQTEGYAATMVFNAITNQILAVMPSDPPELRTGLQEARAVIMAQMQAALSGQGVNALSLMQGAALRVGAAVGDVLMELFSTLT